SLEEQLDLPTHPKQSLHRISGKARGGQIGKQPNHIALFATETYNPSGNPILGFTDTPRTPTLVWGNWNEHIHFLNFAFIDVLRIRNQAYGLFRAVTNPHAKGTDAY